MSNYEQKPNTGVIFKNEKKSDKAPEYRGKINVDGKDYEISLWVKEGKNGKFFSAQVQEPYNKPSNSPSKPVENAADDLPF